MSKSVPKPEINRHISVVKKGGIIKLLLVFFFPLFPFAYQFVLCFCELIVYVLVDRQSNHSSRDC